jgi:hypothetical protein
MHYAALVLEPTEEMVDALERARGRARAALATLAHAGRLLVWSAAPAVARLAPLGLGEAPAAGAPDELIAALDRHGARDLQLRPWYPDIRYRHVVKGDDHYYLLSNEGLAPVTLTAEVPVAGALSLIDPLAGTETAVSTLADLVLPPHTTLVVRVAARRSAGDRSRPPASGRGAETGDRARSGAAPAPALPSLGGAQALAPIPKHG